MVAVTGEDEGERLELPALNLAVLLNSQTNGQEGNEGQSEGRTVAGVLEKRRICYQAALVSEIVDGRTVRCMPISAAGDFSALMDEDEAAKVPPVTAALRVPSIVYVNMEEPPQCCIKCAVGNANLKQQLFQLTGIEAPRVDFNEAHLADPSSCSLLRVYRSQHMDLQAEPMGTASAASLSDLVLGRVVLLQIDSVDGDGGWHGRMLLPAVCNSQVEGNCKVAKLYRLLASRAVARERALHGPLENLPESEGEWGRVEAISRLIMKRRGAKGVEDILTFFFGTIFDSSVCPPTMAVTDVAHVMLFRGLAWVGAETLCKSSKENRVQSEQHMLAVEEGAETQSRGVWSLPFDLFEKLPVANRRRRRFSGERSDFPALLIAQLLNHALAPEGGSRKRGDQMSQGLIFAALVVRVVDGDTVRLVPVLSDEAVRIHVDPAERQRRSTVKAAMSGSTRWIMDCPFYPEVELSSWSSEEKSEEKMSMDTRSILTQVYGIDAPEVRVGGVRHRYTGRCDYTQTVDYGSFDLDIGGQPLGVAATRALAELVLGRVVLVKNLGRDRYKRLIGRIFVSAVSDRLVDKEHKYKEFFAALLSRMRGKGLVEGSLATTGVEGVVEAVKRLSEKKVKGLQSTILQCLHEIRLDNISGLVDASEEMLRRGLAIVYTGERVMYDGNEQKDRLCCLEDTAKRRLCGRWGLPEYCQIDPKDFRHEHGRNRGGKPRGTLRQRCMDALLGITEAVNGSQESGEVRNGELETARTHALSVGMCGCQVIV
ncbi:hypothetical protein, conserved [Eimeria tenella]|uniref:TNase-like domain-containing protein n=1 Tax=Eimeria tenella TaxID=5802 RepID=U6KV38_EIMTE|nr:hypothetical protein, conserved [Eimeria tenella]CDJ41836.1 hypothetical protein, conserved [Eimeria tenella]|eukprot:XP_013232586.1 hypothetical protein, conserved [Eimeria tenella]